MVTKSVKRRIIMTFADLDLDILQGLYCRYGEVWVGCVDCELESEVKD